MNASVNASIPSCIDVFSAHGLAVLHLSKEKKTSKSLEVEKSLRQKKNVGRDLVESWVRRFFWALPFFLAPRIGALFIFSGVGTSNDVRCRVLSADGDACIHRCR